MSSENPGARVVGRITIVVVLLAAFTVATADNKKIAREAYQRATKQYNLGEYQRALEAFTEAYNAVPDPSLLFNLGQCQRQLGAKQKAVTLYKSYLREASSPPNGDEVRRIIAGLEEAIEKDRVAAAVPPNGPMQNTPPTADPPAGRSESPAPEVAPTKVAVAASVQRSGRTKVAAGAGVAALGVVALVAGAALEGIAKKSADQLTADGRADRPFDPAAFDRGKTLDRSGIALLAVGGVAAVVGIVVTVIGLREKRQSRMAVRPQGVQVNF